MSELEYGHCRETDIPALLDLWRDSEGEPSPTDDKDAIEKCLAHDQESIILAWEGGQLVGSIIASWDGWRGNVYRLAVAPTHRRRGIGTGLVQRAEARLTRLGARRITGLVFDSNEVSLALFRRHGWNVTPRLLRLVGPKQAPKRTSEHASI